MKNTERRRFRLRRRPTKNPWPRRSSKNTQERTENSRARNTVPGRLQNEFDLSSELVTSASLDNEHDNLAEVVGERAQSFRLPSP